MLVRNVSKLDRMKITRRELAAVVTPAVAAIAQTTPPTSPLDELKAAQARLKASADALSRADVPMDIEPAFQFKA
jgi:hypothetical protein